jgi:thiol-disulfide isomerase/thioredoxin
MSCAGNRPAPVTLRVLVRKKHTANDEALLERWSVMVSTLFALVLSAVPAGGPRFIEDDYPAALARAKKENKLLFVDAWAPWCHTCIFMRQHVLNQPGFKRFEKRVVFAAVDTEQQRNQPFVEKFPVENWPTLFFINPKDETVAAQFAGAVDESMLAAMIDAANAPIDALRPGKAADDEMALKQQIVASQKSGVATLGMLLKLLKAKKYEVCAKAALDAPKNTDVERAALVGAGFSCALELPASKAKDALVSQFVTEAKAAVQLPKAFADDVSALYELLVDERHAAGDEAGSRQVAEQWLSFLEAKASAAKAPAARAVFDPHRVTAAIALGAPQRAVSALVQSEKDFPLDYNPPARLALLYQEMDTSQWPLAFAAIERAFDKCKEGPRKVRLFLTKASVLRKLQKPAEAQAVLEAGKLYAASLPAGQRAPGHVRQLDQALAEVHKK